MSVVRWVPVMQLDRSWRKKLLHVSETAAPKVMSALVRHSKTHEACKRLLGSNL